MMRALLFLILFSACGVKGPPLPPERVKPEAEVDEISEMKAKKTPTPGK